MKRHPFAVLVVVCLAAIVALALGGCSGSSQSSGGTTAPPATAPSGSASSGGDTGGGTTVAESNFAFSPSSLTVKAGDTVTFKNQDSAPHEVKIDNQDLGKQGPGQDVTWKASKAGSYPYACVIHPSMTGQITVQ